MKSLLSSFAKSGIGVVLSAVFGLLLLRVISTELGMAGIAKFGIYRQFIQFCTVFLSWGNGFSLIETFSKSEDKQSFINNCYRYFQIVTIIISITVAVFSGPISVALFDDEESRNLILFSPIVFIGLSHFSFYRFLLAAKNHLLSSGILQALPFLFMLIFISFSKDISTFFIASYVSAAVVGYFIWRSFGQEKILFSERFFRMPDFERSSVATIITGAVGFFCPLIVKSICVHYLGLETTGVIEAEYSLVSYFTLAIISGLGTFYLAKVSEFRHDLQFRVKIFTFLVPITSLGLCVLLIFERAFFQILFGEHLLSYAPELRIFALGEMLRCINWFFIFTMIGLGQRKAYISFDTIANITYIFSSLALVSYYPVRISIEYGYLIFQFIYFLLNLYLSRRTKSLPLRTTFSISGGSIAGILLLLFLKDLSHG